MGGGLVVMAWGELKGLCELSTNFLFLFFLLLST